MALFEFICAAHGRFDSRCGYKELKMVKCPVCGGEVRRVFSPFSFSFGWRLTDESNHVKGKKDEWEKVV